ncbi:MAG: SCP2 sterol-binding domain-containing protein [Desulfatibacillum sp.]|nr:SCP2 sterol-binding domain-containing protein [Desulfatibacillum sp.]
MAAVPNNISIKELLTQVMPEISKKALEDQGKVSELAGTEVTMTVETSTEKYSFTIKDGVNINVVEGDMDSPNVRMTISNDDLLKMIAQGELDMLLGMSSDLNAQKVSTLKQLSGAMKVNLANDDGSSYTIQTVFNGALSPACTMNLKTSDSAAIIKKETSPVTLFMAGQITMDGDMGFAMGFQPLVT